MLQPIIACLLLSNAACLRLGSVPDWNECHAKTQKWISEGGVRRLAGPAFFFHVNHHNGRGITGKAGEEGGYRINMFSTWVDVDHVKAGKTISSKGAHNGYKNDSMFKDKSWTDIEDPFGKHGLHDLLCGPESPRIFVTSARHPVENLLSQRAYVETKKQGLMLHCASDNIALRFWAGNVCEGTRQQDCRVLTRRDLEIAKARARKMDAIFILEHYSATIKLGCTRLGWKSCTDGDISQTYSSDLVNQLDNQSWNELFERNKLGIEFYDYLKQLSFDMLKEDALPVPTKEEQDKSLSLLRSLQDARKFASVPVPDVSESRYSASTRFTRWQCGRG